MDGIEKFWEQFKGQLGMRLRWIGGGVLAMIIAMFIWRNSQTLSIHLVLVKFDMPAYQIYLGLVIAGLILGKIARFITAKLKVLEGKYRQRLSQATDSKPGGESNIAPA